MEFPAPAAALSRAGILACLLLALPAAAQIDAKYEAYAASGVPATGHNVSMHYVDWTFNSSVAGHNNYTTMDGPRSGVKFLNYKSYSYTGSPGRCFTISTTHYNFASADPQILVKTSSGIWQNLADDVTGTHPRANIYFYGGGNTRSNPKIRVAAFGSYRNNDNFYMRNNWYTDDFNTCLEGTGDSPASAYVDSFGNLTIRRSR